MPSWTRLVAGISSRSAALSRRSGIGVSQISASIPSWCDAWPVSIGPPRGCAMSPTNRPGHPAVPAASAARRSTNAISIGCPQARFRDGRITCQFGPSAGSAVAPATQPFV